MGSKDKTKISYTNTVTMLSVFAIAISLITIALFFFKVKESSVVDSGTYISIIATFIGICATFVIGFQILNALSVDSRISMLNQITDDTKQDILNNNNLTDDIKKDIKKVNGLASFLNAKIESIQEQDRDAMVSFLKALYSFVCIKDHDLINRTLNNMDITLSNMEEQNNDPKGQYGGEGSIYVDDFKMQYDRILKEENAQLAEPRLSNIYNKIIKKNKLFNSESKEE